MDNDVECNEINSSCSEPLAKSLDGEWPLADNSWTDFLEDAFQRADENEKTALAVAYLLGRSQQKSKIMKRSKGRPKGSTRFGIPTDIARYLAYLALLGILAEDESEPAGLTRTSDKLSYLRDLEANNWDDPTKGLLAELLLDPMVEKDSLLSSIRAGRAACKRRIKAG